jgi:hypothetical protein
MRHLRNHYPSSVVFARNLTTGIYEELGSEVTGMNGRGSPSLRAVNENQIESHLDKGNCRRVRNIMKAKLLHCKRQWLSRL